MELVGETDNVVLAVNKSETFREIFSLQKNCF